MILVHRLKGEPLYLNADLIELVEARPDTVITLADGRKMVVAETPAEIVELSRLFRASVIVASDKLHDSDIVASDKFHDSDVVASDKFHDSDVVHLSVVDGMQ